MTSSATCVYQGAPGALSHEVCGTLFPEFEAVGVRDFVQALDAVREGRAARALLPVEDHVVGAIEPAARLVEGCGLAIVREIWWPARLALLGLPGASLGDIRSAGSHPVALRQCAVTLRALQIVPTNAFDTDAAARAVMEAGDPSRAAIAPVSAAALYRLHVLREPVQDVPGDRTRFVLLAA